MPWVPLLALVLTAPPPEPEPLGIGDTAPSLDGMPVVGQGVAAPPAVPANSALPATSDGNQILVVDFFATWCGPCHKGLSDLVAIADAVGPRVRFVLVDASEDPAVVRDFVARQTLPAGTRVMVDSSGTAARRWGSARLPTTFLVDGAGVVRHINRGWGPRYRARLTHWLRAMLAASAPADPPPKSPADSVSRP